MNIEFDLPLSIPNCYVKAAYKDKLHVSWLNETTGEVLVFEHIPDSFPGGGITLQPTVEDYQQSIIGVDWMVRGSLYISSDEMKAFFKRPLNPKMLPLEEQEAIKEAKHDDDLTELGYVCVGVACEMSHYQDYYYRLWIWRRYFSDGSFYQILAADEGNGFCDIVGYYGDDMSYFFPIRNGYSPKGER